MYLTVECAWCGSHISGPGCPPISHGICGPCMEAVMEEQEPETWDGWRDIGGEG